MFDRLRFDALRHGGASWRNGLSRCHGLRGVSRHRDARHGTRAEYRRRRLCHMAVASQRRGRPKDPATPDYPVFDYSLFGGLLVLGGRDYFVATGLLLVAAATLMVFKRMADIVEARTVRPLPAAVVGAGAGFISGLTGVGGGLFLTPLVIALGWASPKHAATISPPFILCNSVVGLLGVLLAGQKVAPGTRFYSLGALSGGNCSPP
jgi:hypothetical protein